MKERRSIQKLSLQPGMDPSQSLKCKIVVVGDSQCGKTALLHVFAKDCFPENYVPTVFENYTASFEIDKQRIELSLWDTSGYWYVSRACARITQERSDLLSGGTGKCPADRCLRWASAGRTARLALTFGYVVSCLCQAVGFQSAVHYCLGDLGLHASHSCSPYYDNVRPLSYPDSDAVIICFDISRPETLDSVLKKWKGEIQEFCPNTKMLLVGCKSDLRTDLTTLVELSNHRQTPVSYDQGSAMAKQISAPYIECSAVQSENSVRDIFHVATLACVNKNNKNIKRNKSARSTKRISHMPSRPDLAAVSTDLRKDKAKSCTVM
ncbi:Rho-related GTP-binding protein RhoE [Anabarilius grahami]|uniref:Rho-related GTP-binding protein RhoE n=1 Tax=Anabarilius grahami TaxID=495550 RepID=A0A3N0Y3W9_ANAGA|nr:Rho-related GTP-binding protein RhoE [Anabarilius grahami]